MTLETMKALYELFTAAHTYILGFAVEGILYYVMTDFATLSRYFKMDRMSSARGGFAKIRIKLTVAQKAELLRMAKPCGTMEDLFVMPEYNKGDNFERLMMETLTTEKWAKNSVPFNVAGDIRVNGEEIQVKFDGCEITNERYLRKLTNG